MPDTVVVRFANGNTVRFGHDPARTVIPSAATSEILGGLSDAALGLSHRPTGGLGEAAFTGKIADKSSEAFSKALGALGDVVASLEAAVGRLEKRPDKVEIEFSASLEGDCDLWVVSGTATAEFKVTLGWGT